MSVVGTNVPTVTQLSNNVKMTSKDIYYSGNPNLRNEYSYTNALLYNFYSKYLDLELILSHLYKTSPIIGYYNEEGNHFIYKFGEWKLCLHVWWTSKCIYKNHLEQIYCVYK